MSSADLFEIFKRLTDFVKRVFKTNIEVFFDALKRSPNAQGYVAGSITELLLKQRLEREHGIEVQRILEKWEGKKHPSHHGDFYIRRPPSPNWNVLESKGGKSNSDKWHKLYNLNKLSKFLQAHSEKISWIDQTRTVEPQIEAWLRANLPKFYTEFRDPVYAYEEIQRYLQNPPKRPTEKLNAIKRWEGLNRNEVNAIIDERIEYLKSKVMVLETHFVSGQSGSGARTQATPRKDEFNIVAVDLCLRYPQHKFLFANPKHLDSSASDANHLQQNYVIGFVFFNGSENPIRSVTEEWSDSFDEVFATLTEADCVAEADMQIDNRNAVVISESPEELTDEAQS